MATVILLFLLISTVLVLGDELHPRSASFDSLPVRRRSSASTDWHTQGINYVKENANQEFNTKTAKNVILFLGDGMSIATVTATRAYLGGEEVQLAFDKFPYYGLSKTYCVDSQVADSACSATAYLSGVKNNIGGIGVTANVSTIQCTFTASDVAPSILKWAQDAGKGTGIVTTTRVTHATPAGAYAHIPFRDWEYDMAVSSTCRNSASSTIVDIADQLINGDEGRNIKVVLGGGRRNFITTTTVDEEGARGLRQDGRNLINEYLTERNTRGTARYVWNKQQLNSLDFTNTDYLLGLFESDHLMFKLDVEAKNAGASEPMLNELTSTAIKMLQKEKNGYFLLVEGGKIDHAHHGNQARKALDETAEFSKAVEAAKALTNDDDTLIVVTSDHSHVFTFAGYPHRGNDVLTTSSVGMDNLPYETLSYANGPGYARTYTSSGRADITNDNFGDINRMYSATVPLQSETHAGEDVGVFASGPWSHLFQGSYEQNTIPVAMAYAAKIGPYQ